MFRAPGDRERIEALEGAFCLSLPQNVHPLDGGDAADGFRDEAAVFTVGENELG